MFDIVVSVSRLQPWSHGVEYAGALAAALGGSLTGAYVYPAPLYTLPPYSSPALISVVMDSTRAVEAVALGAGQSFRDRAEDLGVRRVAWQIAEGFLPDVLSHIANWHDLIVLERDVTAAWGKPSDVGNLVMTTAAPCVVVPLDPAPPAALNCVVLGYNGSPESIRAIHSALPLLAQAERVIVLSGARRDPFMDNWRPPFDIAAHLKKHGITSEHFDLGADGERAGPALLDAANEFSADLLVMGAYGHSRIQEWMFGGATRHVLEQARLPVLMQR